MRVDMYKGEVIDEVIGLIESAQDQIIIDGGSNEDEIYMMLEEALEILVNK